MSSLSKALKFPKEIFVLTYLVENENFMFLI